MQSIQALRERRTALAQSIHDALEKNPGEKWNKDHQAAYDQTMAEIEDIDGEVKRINAYLEKIADESHADAIAQRADRKARDQNKPELGLYAKWLRGGDKSLSADDWVTLRNTMSTTTGSEGGYTVPTEVARNIIDSLKQFGGMRAVADVFTTSGFGSLNYPTSDGTSETGEIIGQNTTATAADATFGTVALDAYKFGSKVVAVPFELIQDSAIDVEAFVQNRLRTRLGRVTNTYYTTGTGTNQPRGVVTGAASGKVGTTGQTLTVIFDDLVDLIHAIDPAYRALGNCRFMMNDASMKVIRKIKDSQGRPIFLPGYDGLGKAMPDTVLGYGVQINQDIAVMAANAKSILFGDFSFYKIRDVMSVQMFRFDDSAYIKLGQIGFLAWMRSGGNLVDAGAVKYYANSAT